ncbi:MAG: PD-(D/E)XK nuclease-like domain-containing protein [Bacteroidia bacterium]|jgi:exodeoxyribonuclease VIII
MKNIETLSAREYHARTEISKHGLDLVAKAPALYKHHQLHPQEQSPAMRWGEIIHTAVLEPERFTQEYIQAPEGLNKTSRKAWAEFESENPGKSVVSRDEWDEVAQTVAAISRHKIARLILTKVSEEKLIEKSLFWIDGEIPCRCRPDGISETMKMVVDLKTCANATASAFAKDAYNYRYHVQAAFYLDACKAVGLTVENFVFICVEKTAPYLTSVFVADEEMIEQGRKTYKADLEKYASCLAINDWPGYPEEIQFLSLPSYAK